MPAVTVKFRPPFRKGEEQGELVFALLHDPLPEIVARALHVQEIEDAHLTADDIDVTFLHAHHLDVGKKNIEIMIIANNYMRRAEDLTERRIPQMQRQIRSLLDLSGFKVLTVSLYVGLAKGGYAEF